MWQHVMPLMVAKDINAVLTNEIVEEHLDPTERSLKEQVNDYEEDLIRTKLMQYKGNVAAVLNDLKIERRTFNQKLARYHISSSDYKK